MRRKLSDQLRWDREQLARYGIGVDDAQRVVENAIGGDNVSTVVNGQEGYRVSVAASTKLHLGKWLSETPRALGTTARWGDWPWWRQLSVCRPSAVLAAKK